MKKSIKKIIALMLVVAAITALGINAFAAESSAVKLAELAGDVVARSTQYPFIDGVVISLYDSEYVTTGRSMISGEAWRIAVGENSGACALTVWLETASHNQSSYGYIYESNDGLGYGDCTTRFSGTHYVTIYNEGRTDNSASSTEVDGYYRDL